MLSLSRINRLLRRLIEIPSRLDAIQRSIGRIELRQNAANGNLDFSDAEFQVSSQWGEDGLIQFLIRRVPIERRIFIEFGVEDYREANTRFLLQNDNWSGLVIDGSEEHIETLRRDAIYWRYNIKAKAAFIDAENIDALFASEGISGDIGLLSVDIDGNDYWVWQKISSVSPRIVIAEFNGIFGPSATVSVPYDPKFTRSNAHSSHLFYGASLGALVYLAGLKGYSLVGINRNANNAFFVRNDVLGAALRPVSITECYRPTQYREARDDTGKLLYRTQADSRELIANLEVVDVRSGSRVRVGDLPLAPVRQPEELRGAEK
jgi:hypothetical protein